MGLHFRRTNHNKQRIKDMKLVAKVARTRNVARSTGREKFSSLAAAVARNERAFIAVSQAGVLYDHKEKKHGVISELLKPVIRRNKEGENLPKEERQHDPSWNDIKSRVNTFLAEYSKGTFTCGEYTVELDDGSQKTMYVIQPGPDSIQKGA